MESADLLRRFVLELTVFQIRDVCLQVLPIVELPRGSVEKLVSELIRWADGDVEKRLPHLWKHALRYKTRDSLAWFLRVDCEVKFPRSLKKDQIADMVLAQLLKRRSVDVSMAADLPKPSVDGRTAVDVSTATAVADPMLGAQLVETEPLRRLRKVLKRSWIKGASLMRRKQKSEQIRRRIKAYTLEACADSTVYAIRTEIARDVKISLGYGKARAFFDRQLSKHLNSLRKKKRKKRQLDPAETMRKYELECMEYEDALSEALD